jgi:endo-1,4-beta-xylanase
MTDPSLSRRSLLLGTAVGAAAAGTVPTLPAAAQTHDAVRTSAGAPRRPTALWEIARGNGLAFGSSTATWQLDDAEYAGLFDAQAEVVFTEDDLLWYRLKPTPDSPLDFSFGDRIVDHAARNRQLVLAAHLVWDEGFGEGWPEDYLWELDREAARTLLFDTATAMVRHYRGRVAGWIAANEVTDPEGDKGFRTDVPWYNTIGKSYVREIFELAHRHDPKATLLLNEFGFETTNEFGDDPRARQRATLQVIDALLEERVPVHALGIQAHLLAEDFADRFDQRQYLRFLNEVADRGLSILITELDVLDDGLPADVSVRDQAIGDIYARYLDTTLGHPSVKALITFGLSDRYTWLQEDFPREDGAERRPLPYDADLQPKPAYDALRRELKQAPCRRPLWGARRR